jgi:hypothetical protein
VIQGRTRVLPPVAADQFVIPDDILRDAGGRPCAAYLGGFARHAAALAPLIAQGGRNGRERWEHGREIIDAGGARGEALRAYVAEAWARFSRMLPDEARATIETTHPATRPKLMPGTGWTGFVANRDVTLNYHRDTSNAPGWTAVLAMRRDAIGGHLHLPELDAWLPMDDGDVAFFPGLTTWHGVSPVSLGLDGYRLTLVAYPKRFVR